MWRRYRYYLKKDFPSFKFEFNKLSDSVWAIHIRDKNLMFTFSVSYSRKNSFTFKVLYEALKNQIKNSLFSKR